MSIDNQIVKIVLDFVVIIGIMGVGYWVSAIKHSKQYYTILLKVKSIIKDNDELATLAVLFVLKTYNDLDGDAMFDMACIEFQHRLSLIGVNVEQEYIETEIRKALHKLGDEVVKQFNQA